MPTIPTQTDGPGIARPDGVSRPLIPATRLAPDVPLDLIPGFSPWPCMGIAAAVDARTVGDLSSVDAGDPRLHGHEIGFDLVRRALRPYSAEYAGWTLVTDCFPDWFLEIPIGDLGLTPKVAGALAPFGTVRGLLPQAVEVALMTPGIGMTAVAKMRSRLRAAMAEAESDRSGLAGPAFPGRGGTRAGKAAALLEAERSARGTYDGSTPFLDHVARNLDLVHGRYAVILAARLGIGRPPGTLRDVAGEHGISRERVRQIQAKATSRIERVTGCVSTLADLLGRGDGGRPWSVTDALASRWAAGMAHATLDVVLDMVGMGIVEAGPGIAFVTPFTARRWQEAARGVVPWLRTRAWDESREGVVAGFVDGLGAEPGHLTALVALADTAFPAGRTALGMAVTAGMWDLVGSMLMPADGTTVTAAVIEGRLRAAGSDYTKLRLGHGFEGGFQRGAVRLGPGTFARIPDPRPDDPLGDAVERVMSSGGKDWRWQAGDVLSSLAKDGVADLPGDVTAMEMRLVAMGRFTRHRPFLWSRGSGTGPTQSHLQESILERNGGPMRTSDLLARLEEARGPGGPRQLRPDHRVVHVGPELWGLASRDISATPAQRAALAAAARAEVAAGNDGLAGIWDKLSAAAREAGVDGPDALGGILRLEGMGLDRTLRLRSGLLRDIPLEGTLGHAIHAALGAAPRGASRAQISERAARAAGTAPSPSLVWRILQQYAVETGPDTWTLRDDG